MTYGRVWLKTGREAESKNKAASREAESKNCKEKTAISVSKRI
jgi:hypothetical protein